MGGKLYRRRRVLARARGCTDKALLRVQIVNSDAHDFLRVCDGAHDGCDKPILMHPTTPDAKGRLPDWAIILIIVGSIAFVAFMGYVCLWKPIFFLKLAKLLKPTRAPPYPTTEPYQPVPVHEMNFEAQPSLYHEPYMY